MEAFQFQKSRVFHVIKLITFILQNLIQISVLSLRNDINSNGKIYLRG